jgi:hypothetical protein
MSAMDFLRKNRMTITVAGVVLLILVRMLVLLLGTDAVNGYSNSVFWSVCQIAAVVLFVLLLGLPVLMGGKGSAPMGDSRGLRIGAGMAAAVFFVYTLVSLIELLMQFGSAVMMYQVLIPWAAILKVVLSILAVGFFYLLARCGSVLPSSASLILILGPIGLYIFRLIDSFMEITLNPSVDTYALLVVSGGLTLFFLSNLGRALLEGKVKRIFLISSSLSALALSLSSVSTLIFSLLQAPVYAGLIGWADLACDIAMMLVAVLVGQSGKPVFVSRRRHAMVGSAVPTPRRRGRYIPKH